MSSPSEWTVPSFLSSIGVDVSDIDTAAKALMDAGYKTETYLLAASRDSLKEAKVAFPVIDLIIAHQETARQQNQQQPARNKIYCRTWNTEGNHGTYKLPADSCDDLKQQASQKFNFAADKVNLYFIPHRDDVNSRKKIKDNSDLEEFLQLGGDPVVLAWERGSDGSPTELPGQITAPFSGSVASSMSTSTRGHIQKVFQTAVLARDKKQCVVSRQRYIQGCGNVEAAHLIPVAEGKDATLEAAEKASGLFSMYDTCNGISLEKGLHNAFDSYLWCVDEKGIFRLSDAERDAAKIEAHELDKWAGNSLNLNIGFGPGYPTEQILKARYELFLAKVRNKKSKGWKNASKKKKFR